MLALAAGFASGSADSLSPYSAIASLTPAELDGAQVRFTEVGNSTKIFPTLAFTTTGRVLNLSVFGPFYRQYTYAGDDRATSRFSVSTTELKAMVDSVGTLPQITSGGVDSAAFLSFAIYALPDSQPCCFEAVVREPNGRALFTKVLQALSGNAAAVDAITETACALGMLEGQAPVIVDGQVQVALSGVRRNRGTTNFVGKIRVTNTSGQSIAAPLAVALEPAGNVELVDPTGHTCAIQPGGLPYVRFPRVTSLGPGESTDVSVTFSNPDLEPIKAGLMRVFVDSGGR